MTVPLVPAPQHVTVDEDAPRAPLRAEHVDGLVRALAPWAPRAARLATGLHAAVARTTPGESAGAGPAGFGVRADLDASLPAEGYTLLLSADRWELRAADEAGAFWAVRTVEQAVRDGSVPTMEVTDSPTYAVRGVMLDVARHFLDVVAVKRVVDLASAYRLNQLHLHLTDDQGWRIEIEGRPLLTERGAANDVDGGTGGFFSLDDYAHLQKYAAERHVVVVPEVDLPGHTHAAQVAYPEVSPDGVEREPYAGIEVGFSTVAVDADATWALVEDVVASLARHTVGDTIHLGGDEALVLERDDYVRFVERLGRVAASHGKRLTLWQEATGADLPDGTLLQYWTWQIDTDHLARAAREDGALFVASPANHAYLDQKYDEDFPLGLTWAGTVSLEDAYAWDPVAELPGVPAASVVGVEACLWTETIRTLDDVTTMLLPRLPAVAEVAWGSPQDFDRFRATLPAHGAWWDDAGLAFHRVDGVEWDEGH
ncbi:family 20 glycosylhydrolase [Sanguibacter suaedae]|uniref:beta-N-acetylhexosaminidase n=1 Tax=Sanguibacter suaedae TaxID=2795737 RepID=A0A934I242_9MICO|nr:family 20 glycosylhydrolase [Sanguibacter suaedae]MBI9113793.1 family 20 glycosylhydrolase [Sanguibacter suaedae]